MWITKRTNIHRGWIVLGAVLVQMGLGAIYIYSVFKPALARQFPTWSGTNLALPSQLVLACFALSTIFEGRVGEVEKWGLTKETIQKIRDCLALFPQVEKVVLYGSRAKGNYRVGSDIDLCIYGTAVDTNLLLKIEEKIDDLMLPHSVDFCIHHLLDNKNFVDHIDRVGQVFYAPDTPALA